MQKLEEAGDSRREVYALIEDIPYYGSDGADSLMVLASHLNPIIREFSVMHLGSMEERESEDIVIHSMYDSIKRVRSSAIVATGKIGSESAVDSLTAMLINTRQENNIFLIYEAIGAIGNLDAIPVLAEGLKGGERYNQISALSAIMQTDPHQGLNYAFSELQDENVDVRRNAVIICIQSGDARAIDPLKSLYEDEDFEVRFYAKQGVKRLISEPLETL